MIHENTPQKGFRSELFAEPWMRVAIELSSSNIVELSYSVAVFFWVGQRRCDPAAASLVARVRLGSHDWGGRFSRAAAVWIDIKRQLLGFGCSAEKTGARHSASFCVRPAVGRVDKFPR